MNILYVNFSFNVGGVEKLILDIVNSISKDKGNKVYLCIINDDYNNELISNISDRVNTYLMNRKIGGSKLKYIIQFTKYVLRNKINVIHCQSENGVKFSLLSKILKPNLKLYTTIHDTKIYENLKRSEVLLEKIFCTKIIAISESVKKEIASRGIKKDKIVKIYNAIDTKKFDMISKKMVNENRVIKIGNVSRLVPNKKGQDVLIKAIKILKDRKYIIECYFAGDDPTPDKSNLKYLTDLSSKLGINENVKFLLNVYNIPRFLDGIDIFVMSSRYEGFGISLIEAMSKGIPCIASNVDGPKEIINNNKYGLLFESENPDDLADKLEYRINNMDKVDRNKINKYVLNNFNIPIMINKLNELYEC